MELLETSWEKHCTLWNCIPRKVTFKKQNHLFVLSRPRFELNWSYGTTLNFHFDLWYWIFEEELDWNQVRMPKDQTNQNSPQLPQNQLTYPPRKQVFSQINTTKIDCFDEFWFRIIFSSYGHTESPWAPIISDHLIF